MSSDEKLVTVVQVYRHGARTPLKPFKNVIKNQADYDPPEGYANLTKEGKQQMYNLGKLTRQKYHTLLGPEYTSKNFKIISSANERNMMSSQLFVAGLYPLTKNTKWHETIDWHPIPIYESGPMITVLPHDHIVPEYVEIMHKVQGDFFKKHGIESGLVDYISKNVGRKIVNQNDIGYFSDFCIQSEYAGLPLADWLTKIYPGQIRDYYHGFLGSYYQGEYATKMYVGGLLNEILKHMEKKASNPNNVPNFLAITAHDTSLSAILYALKAHDSKWPEVASYMSFELWKKNGKYLINIRYSFNGDVDTELVPFGGSSDIGIEELRDGLRKILVDKEELLRMHYEQKNVI